MLHGLSQNRDDDLNLLQHALNSLDYCTYSLTYGAHALAPWVGGLTSMRTSSADEIASFILSVYEKTGSAQKINIVGHSEGAVQALYVPLTHNETIAPIIDHIVALAPAIHGASYFGIADLWYFAGRVSRDIIGAVIDAVGCPACEEMVTDGRVYEDFKNVGDKGVLQDGNKITIVMSRSDTLVPAEISVLDDERVEHVYVQDTCPDDSVGHFGLSWDRSVWRLVVNALEGNDDVVWPCEQGLLF
ncbi:alpha/beta-hydrolase [Poronia punctata]|nr:alpha/beta-hydrolase [Poronia punctata]